MDAIGGRTAPDYIKKNKLKLLSWNIICLLLPQKKLQTTVLSGDSINKETAISDSTELVAMKTSLLGYNRGKTLFLNELHFFSPQLSSTEEWRFCCEHYYTVQKGEGFVVNTQNTTQ